MVGYVYPTFSCFIPVRQGWARDFPEFTSLLSLASIHTPILPVVSENNQAQDLRSNLWQLKTVVMMMAMGTAEASLAAPRAS